MGVRILHLLIVTTITLAVGNGVAFAGPYEVGRAAHDRGDYATALKLMKPLAERGNAAAQDFVGFMYANGVGVSQDDEEALKWFRMAAEKGFAHAQTNLGSMYANGRGVLRDSEEAIKWFRLAAAQGDTEGEVNLGTMYANGQGVSRDDEEAVKWFRIAAEKGNVYARIHLGWMYQYGFGVQKDDTEALKWYQLAAGLGSAEAQNNLGAMYATGEGVPKDYVLSYMWLTVGKGNLAIVVSEMTSAQIAQVLKMAKRCQESAYQQCGKPRDDSFGVAITSVPMQIEGGINVVPVLINDAITLNFVVDSGATDVSIPADVVMTLIRTGTLKRSDFLGQRTYVLADGSETPSQTFRIRSLKVGNRLLEDVTGSIASVRGSLLLDQSFLGRFKSWSVDNTKHVLLLSE
jgi:predicted aspartyl protease